MIERHSTGSGVWCTITGTFTTLTGQAPMTYVTAWRMTVASRLLREGQQPLREIAHRGGYDSEFAFARAFKRTVGHAPGRYRAAVGHPDRALSVPSPTPVPTR